ncbi:MAG: TolC family protein [Bdellovibrionales bacterium]|nr:TolC family protein [Bdellovibrionales bacterium]
MLFKILVTLGALASIPIYAEPLKTIDELLHLAYENNPGVKEYRQSWKAEDSLVVSQATLDDPVFGVSELDRGLKTQYGTISQKIRFPTQYIYQSNAQQSKADRFQTQFIGKRFEVRQQVTTLYFAIYSAQKIIQLTQANMESVKEFARVAEKKYAAGKSSQSDSMKAHFELTQLELDLIRLKQEEQALQDSLRAVVGLSSLGNIVFHNSSLSPPHFYEEKLNFLETELLNRLQENSPVLMAEAHKLKEVEHKSSLAKWEVAPDFQLQYQQRISGDPTDSSILSVGITVPL